MNQKKRKNSSGFTLVELLVVVVILMVIGTISMQTFRKEPDKARVQAARTSFSQLETALERYKLDSGTYPAEEEGLLALVVAPDDDDGSWGGPYMRKKTALRDPWGNDYLLQIPASDGTDYELICLGADGAEGGEGFNADLSSLDE
ncbi:type II secretion system major pseudopilin GspG [Pontiella sulfatireligans]|uniref:Type II secretion system core protein G n=1 Tax=Pontiella sulfatireligans TaxID=2750658 RepID=A0A6C2USH7_9BACT|nr:type II secretion system major pseudopilin GspG [Pontiella sulfatireligans]VGO22177.1 Type II secretion system protein G [Pontiella sulfatireligans]